MPLALGVIHLTTDAVGSVAATTREALYHFVAAAAVLLLGLVGNGLPPVLLMGASPWRVPYRSSSTCRHHGHVLR